MRVLAGVESLWLVDLLAHSGRTFGRCHLVARPSFWLPTNARSNDSDERDRVFRVPYRCVAQSNSGDARYARAYNQSRTGTLTRAMPVKSGEPWTSRQWSWVDHRGSFRNTTVNGQITGFGLDLGVIDDNAQATWQTQDMTEPKIIML